MHQELADFLDYCRVERRLAPLTCSAYERESEPVSPSWRARESSR
jgi:site-specific recombinase XerC